MLTSLLRAEAAVPREVGSRARSVIKRPYEEVGKVLKVSSKLGL